MASVYVSDRENASHRESPIAESAERSAFTTPLLTEANKRRSTKQLTKMKARCQKAMSAARSSSSDCFCRQSGDVVLSPSIARKSASGQSIGRGDGVLHKPYQQSNRTFVSYLSHNFVAKRKSRPTPLGLHPTIQLTNIIGAITI